MKIQILPPGEAAKKARERVAEWKRQREIDAAKQREEGKKAALASGPAQKVQKPRTKEEQKKLDIELRRVARGLNEDVQRAQGLLDKGANINSQSTESDFAGTALVQAARHSRKKMMKFLIENGADVNAKDRRDHTALMYAVEYGHTETAELLRKHGATE